MGRHSAQPPGDTPIADAKKLIRISQEIAAVAVGHSGTPTGAILHGITETLIAVARGRIGLATTGSGAAPGTYTPRDFPASPGDGTYQVLVEPPIEHGYHVNPYDLGALARARNETPRTTWRDTGDTSQIGPVNL